MNQEFVKTYAENIEKNKKWFEFIKHFGDDSLESGYLRGATFELTAFCTLKCPMCYVRIDKERANALGGKSLSTAQWIDLARQFRDQGGLFLLLTGGEPMMRPDFLEIYNEISKMGLLITLFTNGTTVDDKMLEVLRKRPPAMVGLTIYGSSEATYKRYGGSEGSFKRAVDGLDRLLTIPNLAIDVRFVACSENYKDYKEVYELVAERGKLVSLDFGSLTTTRGATSDARKLRLTNDQMDELNLVVKQINDSLEELTKTYNAVDVLEEVEPKLEATILNQEKNRGLRCNAGKTNVYIAWDGRMYMCNMATYPYTFPLEQGFKAAVADLRHQTDSLLMPERCLSCANHHDLCTCIPKAQNEMRDCARLGERCNYTPIPQGLDTIHNS